MKATLGILAAMLLVPAAAAGSFGTTLRSGDVDYYPSAKAASLAVSVNEATFGTGPAKDNCLLLDTATAAAAGAQYKDIRLTACIGKAAGTQIQDADVTERTIAYPQVAGENVQYADVNGNGKYDAGEYVYVTTKAAPGLAAMGVTGTWTVRLTPAGNLSAGTFAMAGDPDFTSWSSSTAALAASIVERDDGWFLVPVAAGGVAKYGPIPANSLRLLDAPPAATVEPTAISISPTEPASGQAFVVTIEVQNKGKVAGSALISTKLAGKVVDARGTPNVAAGKTVTLVLSLVAPSSPGVILLQTGTLQKNVTVVESTDAKAMSALQDRIALLEEALGESQWTVAKPATVEAQGTAAGAPSPSMVALVLVVVVTAWASRRRGR